MKSLNTTDSVDLLNKEELLQVNMLSTQTCGRKLAQLPTDAAELSLRFP